METKNAVKATKTALVVTLIVAAVLVLSACQSGGVREGVGTLAGAAAGAWAGSKVGDGSGQVIATVLGAGLGAWIGRDIGRQLDAAAQQAHSGAVHRALQPTVRAGDAIQWDSPASATPTSGTVTVRRTGTAGGRACREYQDEITIGGERATKIGTVCQRPDGVWEEVSG